MGIFFILERFFMVSKSFFERGGSKSNVLFCGPITGRHCGLVHNVFFETLSIKGADSVLWAAAFSGCRFGLVLVEDF